ncbi:AAA family ATPase [Dielma fastidiosa]|jgi:predicted ATP-dependent endonuclease of OLD family|uniref:AAA family ATPase n=1 Tax=Dielma fastidiosa TaxID=1034346 RepID=UPI000D797C5D|nr:AAA family ATPase [Dielma fastidiosa]MBS6168627.1 AAA family ATPase [Bacillota bacterium]PWM54014.1 MAG: chromosome segregation protein SMC [Dielma fastidiosa]
MENIKINKLEIENVKRVKAVKIEPTPAGLTVVGGKNNQGKTSVLDSIAWALGGEKHRPSQPQREGSVLPPTLKVQLSNGLIVERKGKNSDLKVTDPNGRKGGQQLLNEFVEQLAIDLPKFMESTGKEKAQTLLKIIGVGDQLVKIEIEEHELYNQRRTIGQIADQKQKYADEQVFYQEAPKELVSPSELIKQQQDILARNGDNQRKREKVEQIKWTVTSLQSEVAALEKQLQIKKASLDQSLNDLNIAQMDALDLQDESTAELEASIANIDEINRKVRANLDKEKAEEDAKNYKDQYDSLTAQINQLRNAKFELLNKADMPLPELSVENGELIYKGYKWDNMSGSDQLKVATAIVRKLNPKCGFVLLDKLEQMDLDTMNEFGHWLEQEGLQAIATRVSTGDECSIIIEDGYVQGKPAIINPEFEQQFEKKEWKVGSF